MTLPPHCSSGYPSELRVERNLGNLEGRMFEAWNAIRRVQDQQNFTMRSLSEMGARVRRLENPTPPAVVPIFELWVKRLAALVLPILTLLMTGSMDKAIGVLKALL